jgi:hypothetical protein
MRRVAFALVLLLGAFVVAAPVSAASASSWHATITGHAMFGGATTLIRSDGTGSLNARVTGVTPGQQPILLVNPLACPAEAQDLFGFNLSRAGADGVSTGSHALTKSEVKAYRDALTRRTHVSVLIVTGDDKGCGDQVGAPSVGTGRLRGSIAEVHATYDIRYPVIGELDPAVAARVNDVLYGDSLSTIAIFQQQAIEQGAPMSGFAPSVATQTFSISLAEPTLISLGELYSQYMTGAAHPLDTLSTYTFDLKTGREITLSDLFRPGSAYLKLLSTESRARLRAILAPAGFTEFINDGTTPKASNFTGWQLVPGGLKITFGEYQVAPFAAGMPSIVIPWSHLRSVLNFSSAAAPLVPIDACVGSQLVGHMSMWEGGVGSRFNTVTATNRSNATCYVQGEPRAQLIDGAGHIVLDNGEGTTTGARIQLAPGQSAEILVILNNYCGGPVTDPVRIVFRLAAGGSVVGIPDAEGSVAADALPPCNGPVGTNVITTTGWHRA